MTEAKPADDLDMDEILNAPIAFGLKSQGHIPTIERMLAEAWDKIGNEIGWMPSTAREHYERITSASAVAAAREEVFRDLRAKCEAAANTIWGEFDVEHDRFHTPSELIRGMEYIILAAMKGEGT